MHMYIYILVYLRYESEFVSLIQFDFNPPVTNYSTCRSHTFTIATKYYM